MAAVTSTVERSRMTRWLEGLLAAITNDDREAADRIFGEAIPSFRKLVSDKAGSNVLSLPSQRAQG